MSDSKHEIRMSKALWDLVGEISHELGYDDDKRGAHSALIREMVAAAAAKWHYSPYVCKTSKHVLLVTGRGDVFYSITQGLKLNAERHFLPCVVEMKPEKRVYFQQSCPPGYNEADWFRGQWIMNYFAAYKGRGLNGERLSHDVDRLGRDAKIADLPLHLGAGRLVTREILVGIKDYVQWNEGSLGYDRSDFLIDLPTHNLNIIVAVDEDLYASTPISSEEIPPLSLEFRNRESARFSGKDVALFPEMDLRDFCGCTPRDEPGLEFMRDLEELIYRLRAVADISVDGIPVVSGEQEEMIKSLRTPKRFLFYYLEWKAPHLGIEACVRWEKPVKR